MVIILIYDQWVEDGKTRKSKLPPRSAGCFGLAYLIGTLGARVSKIL